MEDSGDAARGAGALGRLGRPQATSAPSPQRRNWSTPWARFSRSGSGGVQINDTSSDDSRTAAW